MKRLAAEESLADLQTELVLSSGRETYLKAVEELTLELEYAITTITSGALADFETSLARQQSICVRLAGLARPAGIDSLLIGHLGPAVLRLHDTSRRYAKLVRHFGTTARLFGRIFRPYGGLPAATGYAQRSQRAWFCEL